ncbi:carbohydrate ABC transporter permease [Lapillicoccus jejuensis]|uniref:Carbohydrate ABC transporter membrane protein 2 (CUT1 family) n=1 Tax=Lapillicoccus jejuensis TaxID=402171 RepID=A0A542E136_9MICO|nr:carbohydrate ABC transporter permease [Lapillicoccus jejuensis]TQJ09058.1 carbohydrate ABC transporter membrane protein 2 (CUT1 family) [Lapillicoccus jejuensis]
MTAIARLRDTAPRTVLLTAAALFSVFPLLSMFSAALQPQGTAPAGISFPLHPQWHNFVDAWNVANITTLVQSSAILVLGVVPAAMLISSMAAYAIAQLRIPLGNVFFLLLLLGLTLPYEIVVVPLYYQMQSMGLLNSRLGLILPLIGLNMPFAVFWMRTHFQSVPAELSESSSIDGAGPWQAFRHIQMPLAVPALASLGVLMFLSTWNQFLLAIVLIDDPTKRTMAGALQGFVGAHSTDVVLLNAGALLIMAPTILVFLLFQKFFIRAMLAGAVKG